MVPCSMHKQSFQMTRNNIWMKFTWLLFVKGGQSRYNTFFKQKTINKWYLVHRKHKYHIPLYIPFQIEIFQNTFYMVDFDTNIIYTKNAQWYSPAILCKSITFSVPSDTLNPGLLLLPRQFPGHFHLSHLTVGHTKWHPSTTTLITLQSSKWNKVFTLTFSMNLILLSIFLWLAHNLEYVTE